MRKFIRTGAVWLLLAAWVFLPVFSARAEQVYGSIQITLPDEAAAAELTLYRVAEMNGTQYYYAEGGAFAKSGVSLAGLDTAETAEQAAEQLYAWAANQGVKGTPQTPRAEHKVFWANLTPGLYLAAQTAGQDQVDVQKMLISVPGVVDGQIFYDVQVTAKYTIPEGAVILDKVDDEGGAVPQVTFLLQKKTYVTADGQLPEGTETGSDGSGRYYWQTLGGPLVTDVNGQIAAEHLQVGTYRFMEQAAPGGYITTNDPIYFAIGKPGSVAVNAGKYVPDSGEVEEVPVTNKRTRVSINKVDEDGKGVAGAMLVIRDGDGNIIRNEDGAAVWLFMSDGQPREIRGMPAGDYILSEVAAPDGYEAAADVPFTVTGDTDTAVVVTMVDNRTEPEEGSLSVTKYLRTLSGEDLIAPSGTFYVRLFADEERTQPASNVVPMEFVNASSQTVTFTGLSLDTPYYVSETDAMGTPIDDGTVGENGIFGAVFADGNMVELSVEAPEGAIEFENVFSVPPTEYYYEGVLTVTKRVLKNGEMVNSNETFYAGIFEDPEYKTRYGDVIELAMDGSGELSVEVPVVLGQNVGDSKTYYVTETDAKGVPVAGSAGFKYEASIDKTKVTLSGEHDEETVVITNTETETTAEKGEISVTKHLKTMSGEDLTAASGTFYAALFLDEARTKRATDVLQLKFANASSQTVTFTGLNLGTVYYVSETDSNGKPIDNGTYGEDGVFAASFPDGNKVELTVKVPKKVIAFENVFSNTPKEYYIDGELTITKRVFRNGALAGTSETFYVGIFEDPDYTKRYGDVVELAMDGNSELSVTVPVVIGQKPGDSKTYYVTETDANGTPVAGSASFTYAVSVDKTSVTLTGEHDTDTVTITNSRTETPGVPSVPSGSGSPSGSSPSTSTPAASVRTGDETPVGTYLAVFAASAAALITGLTLLLKKRRRTR